MSQWVYKGVVTTQHTQMSLPLYRPTRPARPARVLTPRLGSTVSFYRWPEAGSEAPAGLTSRSWLVCCVWKENGSTFLDLESECGGHTLAQPSEVFEVPA